MPKVKANGITLNYEQQGTGEPLVLIPYLAADNACYAFQVGEYAKHFTCISVDPRGAGDSDKPARPLFDGIVRRRCRSLHAGDRCRARTCERTVARRGDRAVAGKYPQRVKSLSLHSGWTKSDPFLKAVLEGWRTIAKGLDSVTEMIIQGIFPWCFTPELYAAKPDYIDQLAAFVRGRPKQPLDAFMSQSSAVINHDGLSALAQIKAPTQITFGRHDQVTSTRFADAMKNGIKGSELAIFETCAHAPIYESVAEFNEKTLAFLTRQSG